jgi:hypothetical protein
MKRLGIAVATGLLLLFALAPLGAAAKPAREAAAQARVSGAVRVGQHRRRHHSRRGTPHPAPSAGTAVKPKPSGEAPAKPSPSSGPAPAPAPAPSPQPAPEPSAAGSVLFGSSFDGSFKGWYVQSLPTRATISTAHPFAGSGAARFEVRPGDVEPDTGSQRSEVSGPTFNAGEDLYVRDEIRVPDGYTFEGPWQLVDQLHEDHWGGSPGIATFLDSNRALSVRAGDSSPTYWRGPQLEPERWYDLVYRVKLSQDPTQGFVEVWLDGTQQILANGATRMSGETIQMPQTYLKAGIYRSQYSTGVSIVEHDDIAVGTSLAAVNTY